MANVDASERMAPPAGLEPTRLAPEASALSAELRGRTANIAVGAHHNKDAVANKGSHGMYIELDIRKI